jgi:hypothetical protein
MAFDFALPDIPAESAAQRAAWEQRVLGHPLSVHPLETVKWDGQTIPLGKLHKHHGQWVQVAGVRLPGWTGGKGWFLADQTTYVMAVGNQGVATPRVWKPLRLSGRWLADAWGGEWLQVDEWQVIE